MLPAIAFTGVADHKESEIRRTGHPRRLDAQPIGARRSGRHAAAGGARTICSQQGSTRYSTQRSHMPAAQVSVLKNQLGPQMGLTAMRMAASGRPIRRPRRRAATGEV